MIGFMVDVALVTAIAHLHLRNSVYNIKGFEPVRSAPSARWRGGHSVSRNHPTRFRLPCSARLCPWRETMTPILRSVMLK